MKILSKLFFTFIFIEFLIFCEVLEITHPLLAKYQQQLISFLKLIIVLLTELVLEAN